jgi:ABC-type transport system involved in multi-copper enzyme maturation permease subunit
MARAEVPTVVRVLALARLDLADVMRSRWLLFCAGLYAVLAAMFVLVGMRESGVLGFTGMGRVLLSLCHALVLLLPLLALTGSGQVVNRAREDGTLELLFSHPAERRDFFAAITAVRFLALFAPLFVLLVGLAAAGRLAFAQPVEWSFLGRSLLVSAGLIWSFLGIGLAVSTLVRSQARALMVLLLVWVLGVALLDFALVGVMLQWRLNPAGVFLLSAVNPVESARMALMSAADPELGVLGPVGFFLANRIGTPALLALGVLWPATVGSVAWLAARHSFLRGDLV